MDIGEVIVSESSLAYYVGLSRVLWKVHSPDMTDVSEVSPSNI